MKYLFIHQNFPGQFVFLSQKLAEKKGNQVVALSIYKHAVPKGVQLRSYSMLRAAVPETHPMLQDMEAKVLRAEACAAAAWALKREGFEPDIIIAHPGWGETLFIKDVFPHAKIVMYCEYYYAKEGQDVGFDPEMPALTFDRACRLRLKNTVNLHALELADAAISPTQWQKSTFPKWAQDKISVIHDGINLQRLLPNPKARIKLGSPDNKTTRHEFKPGDEVFSYVARNLEAVRGFHTFMRVLPKVLAARKQAHVIIVGGEDVSYGSKAPGDISWKQYMMNEVGAQLDMQRVHFVGKVPYASYVDLLHVSKVHSYWSTPFVLSWSFLESAMSGLPVVASRTPPIVEFAEQLGVQTLDFFDQDGFAEAISAQLAAPAELAKSRQPRPLAHLELGHCLAEQMRLLQQL